MLVTGGAGFIGSIFVHQARTTRADAAVDSPDAQLDLGALRRRVAQRHLAVRPLVFRADECHGAYQPRAYTPTELARLLDAAEAREPWAQRLAGLATAEERWAALPLHLACERGLSRVDYIADPYRQPQEAFDAMAVEIDAAVAQIVAFEASFG